MASSLWKQAGDPTSHVTQRQRFTGLLPNTGSFVCTSARITGYTLTLPDAFPADQDDHVIRLIQLPSQKTKKINLQNLLTYCKGLEQPGVSWNCLGQWTTASTMQWHIISFSLSQHSEPNVPEAGFDKREFI